MLILLIVFLFILSLNSISAADENTTNISSDSYFCNDLEVSNDFDNVKSDNITDLSVSNDESEVLTLNTGLSSDVKSIKLGKVVKRYNGGVIGYSATFYDSMGNLLKNHLVFCGVDTLSLGREASTDSNGVALFYMSLSKGSHTLYLTNYNTSAVISTNIKVFDVITGGKNLSLYFNSGKSYTVRVYDNNGNPIGAGKKVLFTVNNKKYNIKTDKRGYAKLKINFKPGAYFVTAKYDDFIISNYIIINPTLIPLTSFGTTKLKKTFKDKVKLLNNKGKILKNKKVKVKFNKKKYVAKTNKKGIATFKLKTPTKSGNYKIIFSYGKATASSVLRIF